MRNMPLSIVKIFGFIGFIITIQSLYLPLKAELAQHLLERSWNIAITQNRIIPPWPWADTKPLGRITFLQQQQSFIIMSGSSGRTLAFAPGHLSGSALPGDAGHTIISAHRDTHFRVLETIKINDIISVETVDNEKLLYEISAINIVDIRNEPLILEPDKSLLTLVTCYPFDALSAGSPFRYRVDALKTL